MYEIVKNSFYTYAENSIDLGLLKSFSFHMWYLNNIVLFLQIQKNLQQTTRFS